jgi:phosphohistidine swiveling domain-containing protein
MNLKKIKKTQWYRQQTESNPYFAYQACLGCVTFFKSRDQIIWFCTPEEARAYMDKDLVRKLAEEYLKREKKNPGNAKKMFKDWLKTARQANQKIYDVIDRKGLYTLSDRELLEINKKLVKQTYVMWTKFFMDIYDVDAEGLIERELIKEGINLTLEERSIMTLQGSPIIYQKEEWDLLKIAGLIKKTPGASNLLLYISSPSNLHRLKQFPKIEKVLEEHQRKYFWIRNNWGHTSIVTIYDFVEVLKQILFGSRDVFLELKKLNNYERSLKAKKQKIVRKHKMSKWLRQMFEFFSLLGFWRDERKSEMQRMNHYLELLGREIARRSRLDWHEIKWCDPLSFKGLPVTRELVNNYVKLFNNNPFLIWNGKEVVHLTQKQSHNLENSLESTFKNEMTEIRGMIACPGKVKGEVVVIAKKDEFNKMKKGKILVTNMTRPEFVPLMKMAAGIVTDEGGITSHAAVVSREMNIPCIIGTQVASKTLKDGDKVFVNADHGVVVVLEK